MCQTCIDNIINRLVENRERINSLIIGFDDGDGCDVSQAIKLGDLHSLQRIAMTVVEAVSSIDPDQITPTPAHYDA